MPKSSNNPIPNMDSNWSLDPTANLPYSGKSVENFIKKTFGEKAGAGYFDPTYMILYLFDTEEHKDAADRSDPTHADGYVGQIPINFSTTQRRIYYQPSGSTHINVTINEEEVILSTQVKVQEKEINDPTWNDVGSDVGVRVFIDERNTGNWREMTELAAIIPGSVGVFSVDVRNYLQTGTGRVRFDFYEVEDPTLTTRLIWEITMAQMYIEEWGNDWDKALVENGAEINYHLGGFKIVGNISKTLQIRIFSGNTVQRTYSQPLGTEEYVTSAYKFNRGLGLELGGLSTGIYVVKVWLEAGTLSTEDTAVIYNIMYVAAGEQGTARLVVMNNMASVVNNFDESAHLCDFSIYNAGESYGTPTITITPRIGSTDGTPTVLENQVAAQTKQALNYQTNMLAEQGINLSVIYDIVFYNSTQHGVAAVDNTDVFPSFEGETFYLNPSTRANGQVDRETIYNTYQGRHEAIGGTTWAKMSWVDGMDGWTEDENGHKCLMLPAGTRLNIANANNGGYNFLRGNNITFELLYRVANVSDYDENIITIGTDMDSEGFKGIRIKPTNITMHSTMDSTAAEDAFQGTNIADEETIHLVISIMQNYGENAGKNIVTGYVNGTKNFQFDFSGGWSMSNAVTIFGSDTADLYLYMFRFYGNNSLPDAGAEKNLLNSLFTRDEKLAEKAFIKSVLPESGSRVIDYESVKNSGKYNFFIVEMTEGYVPDIDHPDGGKSNIEMHFGRDADGNARSGWDWKIYEVETKGQGTTSMKYYKWNLRFRIDKSSDNSKERLVSYYDAPTNSDGIITFNEQTPVSRKTVRFDGNNHPPVKRITAKINFASSMQSHKMGATRAYDLLHNSLFEGAMLNEAQQAASSLGKSMPTVAVYQYPAFGFKKTVDQLGNEEYSFIGLFTIGPDKGDKPTFGFDLTDDENPHVIDIGQDIVSLEGTDHTQKMARFCVPWDEQVVYHVDDGDGFLSIKLKDGGFGDAFEVGNAKTAKTDNPTAAMPVLEDTFKPAYDVVYDNSTMIFPIALNDPDYGGANAAAVLANINADAGGFGERRYNDRFVNSVMEFWIEGEYKLYHYDSETEQYVSGKKVNGAYVPLDLTIDTGVDPTGHSLEETNELFKAARRARFKAQAHEYWDMRELVFNYVYLIVFAATDNFAKNQYPIYMGGKWRFRQDDLDTIMDIDNYGAQTKPFDIEYEDALNGSPYFGGSDSLLWNLVHESLWDDFTAGGVEYPGIMTAGKSMISGMRVLSGGYNDFDGFVKFFEKYFWGNAQLYFPPSAYNLDGEFKYIGAWLTQESTFGDPMHQSLGDHASAERLWVRNRAIYCMSLFKAGAFGNYEQAYLGSISFRPVGLSSLTLTPARSMYPSVIIGQTGPLPTSRTKGGQPCTITFESSTGQTSMVIQAIDYLTYIGDLKDLNLDNQASSLSIAGKKLRVFKMGDEDPNEVGTTITGLEIAGAMPCLEIINVRNASMLSGTLNLQNCKRLKEVLADGTLLSAVILPKGSKVEKLYLPDNVTQLSYQVVKYLSDLVLPDDTSGITFVFLEECDALDGMETLESIFFGTSQAMEFIRILWAGEKNVTGRQLSMLARIKQNLDKDGGEHSYFGVDTGTGSGTDPSGSTDLLPHVEGRLLADKYYQADIDELADGQTPADSSIHQGYKEITVDGNDGEARGIKGPLRIAYPLGDEHVYIGFEDSIVRQICATEWGDGTGILKHEAEDVTSIVNKFNGNTQITSFKELRNFTGLTHSNNSNSGLYRAFINCTNLEYIDFPKTSIIAPSYPYWFNYTCYGCTNLKRIYWPYENGVLCQYMFNGCTNLKHVDIDSLEQWAKNLFGDYSSSYCRHPFDASHEGHLYLDGVEITNYVIPGAITQIKNGNFRYCTGLTGVDIPSSVTSIGTEAFRYCNNLAAVIIRATTPPTLSNSNAFGGNATGRKFYVPNGCKNAYTTASAWSSFSEDTFIELDENGNIPT